MSFPNWFGISSEFAYGTLRVTAHAINTETVPPSAILIDQTGEYHEVTLHEALRLYRSAHGFNDPVRTDPASHLTNSLEELSERQVKIARERAEHIREIVYGDPSGVVSADSDPRFDPARSSRTARIALKAEQLADVRAAQGRSWDSGLGEHRS